MKKYIVLAIFTIIIAAADIWLWSALKGIEQELSWVGFAIVWFSLIIGWLTFRRQSALTYLFFSVGLIIELILLIDKFWILGRGI